MSAAPSEQLNGGACYDLRPAVIDKYFMANGNTHRFEFLTARAICNHCPIQDLCLADAIVRPAQAGMRGGASAGDIAALSYRHRQEQIPAIKLARMAILEQCFLEGEPVDDPGLLAGRFEDVPLAYPELGGVA